MNEQLRITLRNRLVWLKTFRRETVHVEFSSLRARAGWTPMQIDADRRAIRKMIRICMKLLRRLNEAIELRAPETAALVALSLAEKVGEIDRTLFVGPQYILSRRWEGQLLILAQNRARRARAHEAIQRDFVRLTSSRAWRNHFLLLTKPRGVYDQLAKRHGLSSPQIARIVEPLMADARRRQK